MKIITNHPVAKDSPDHLFPWGTKYDNNTNSNLINEIENYFNGKKIKFLDIGCSGGQFAVDFYNRGHISIGIEGSDYSIKNERNNWVAFNNKVLFTCDAGKPYQIIDDNQNQIIFDCISSWEVIEHIHPDDLDQFFKNISNHMNANSIFISGISLVNDCHNGRGEFNKNVELHQSVFTEKEWKTKILNKYFKIEEYLFNSKVRDEIYSFYVTLKKL